MKGKPKGECGAGKRSLKAQSSGARYIEGDNHER